MSFVAWLAIDISREREGERGERCNGMPFMIIIAYLFIQLLLLHVNAIRYKIWKTVALHHSQVHRTYNDNNSNNSKSKRWQLSRRRCAARDQMRTFFNRCALTLSIHSLKIIIDATFTTVHLFALDIIGTAQRLNGPCKCTRSCSAISMNEWKRKITNAIYNTQNMFWFTCRSMPDASVCLCIANTNAIKSSGPIDLPLDWNVEREEKKNCDRCCLCVPCLTRAQCRWSVSSNWFGMTSTRIEKAFFIDLAICSRLNINIQSIWCFEFNGRCIHCSSCIIFWISGW